MGRPAVVRRIWSVLVSPLVAPLVVMCGAVGACGGEAFTMAPSNGGDSGAGDSSLDQASSGAAVDSGADAQEGQADAPHDTRAESAPTPDAPADAPVRDATASDAIGLPDVVEEPPAHCGGQFACVPAVPAGWNGPFELYTGSSSPASCSPNFFPSYQGSESLQAQPAACGCNCAAAAGVQCSSPPLSFFVSTAGVTTCSSASHCSSLTLTPGACTGVNILTQCPSVLGTNGAFTAGSSIASGGSCSPIPSTSIPPTTWGGQAHACISAVAPAQVDCQAGSVCAPQPVAPFDSNWCIAQAGDVQCPGSNYTNRTVFYGAVQDDRSCTACTCGAVTGSSCAAAVSVSSSNGLTCTSGTIKYALPASCDPVQQPGEFLLTLSPANGSCAPGQSAPTGSAQPASPTTFCCQ